MINDEVAKNLKEINLENPQNFFIYNISKKIELSFNCVILYI
jgi:hypothetical protein